MDFRPPPHHPSAPRLGNTTSVVSDCPGDKVLSSFLDGELPQRRSRAVIKHLATCRPCQLALDTLAGDDSISEFQKSHRRTESTESVAVPATLTEDVYRLLSSRRIPAIELGEDSEAAEPPTTLGRFQIRERLGAGGFGVVYRADDPQLNRSVALKLPRAGALVDPLIRERFVREAHAAARLHHPHIVTLYEAGVCEGTFYLASAFCAGPTLAEWLEELGRPAAANEAAQLVLALARAVEHAHTLGILHRDIKPENVLLDSAFPYRDLPFSPKLTDFGLAKVLEAVHDVAYPATATGSVVGTPQYMSPEQASGHRDRMGPGTDIYALGVMLYELLTGEAPINGDGHADTLRRVVAEEPLPPGAQMSGIPRDLEAICMKCLEKSPTQRFASARELAEDLERFLHRQPTLTRPVGPLERLTRWVRRRPATAGLIGMTITAVVAALGGLSLYSVRLREFNEDLGRANTRLESALLDAEQSKNRAQESDARTQQLLYVTDMRLAVRARKEGDARLLADLLTRHAPAEHEPDRRGLEWRFLSQTIERPSRMIARHASDIYCLVVSPDGRLLGTAGKDAIVRLYDLPTGKLVRELATGQVEVNGIAFAPDGTRLATAGDDGTVRIWSLEDGQPTTVIQAHAPQAFQVAFTSPDSIVSCGIDPVIRIWDVESGREAGQLVGHEDAVENLTLSPDRTRLASVSRDGTARIWALANRRQIQELRVHPRKTIVFSAAFSPDGRLLATGDGENQVVIWDCDSGTKIGKNQHLDSVQVVAFSADGKTIISGDRVGALYLWETPAANDDTDELRCRRRWQGHEGRAYAALGAAENGFITSGGDGCVLAWQPASGVDPQLRSDRLPECNEIAFSWRDELLALSRDDQLLNVPLPDFAGEPWRRSDARYEMHLGTSSDGRWMIVAPSPHLIELWDLIADAVERTWRFDEEELPRRATLSPDGRLLAVWTTGRKGARSDTLQVFDCLAGDRHASLSVPREEKPRLEFAPHKTHIAFTIDNDLWLWNVGSPTASHIAQAHGNTVTDLAYDPCSGVLATVSTDRLVKLWDPQGGKLLATLSGHRGPVQSLAFDRDGRTLVTASTDGTLKAWNVAAREEMFDLCEEASGFACVRLSPNGRWLAALTGQHRVVLCDLGATDSRPPSDGVTH